MSTAGRGRGALILLYHRVADAETDPWSLCVTPRHFAEQVEILGRHVRTVPLRQLGAALADGKRLEGSVVVTFDDGYADNLHNARPVLERHDVPATFFLTTGYLGGRREFWWDELERLLLQPGVLPERLQLSIDGATHRWELGGAARYGAEAFQCHRGWRAWEDPPTPRHALYRSLWELLRRVAEDRRWQVLDDLRGWAGAERVARATHRPLSLDEVVAMARGELVEIGAHTVTHPSLSALPAASQRDEIQRSKARLEELLGRSVTSFAYPFGARSDYIGETPTIVRDSGYACACSNFTGVVRRSTDRFQLPRVQVKDWGGEEFARRLSGWLRQLRVSIVNPYGAGSPRRRARGGCDDCRAGETGLSAGDEVRTSIEPLGGSVLAELGRRGDSDGSHATLVSVVIPCYDQARFLGEAIESALAQTYPHVEVIVVDDGSPDNTSEVAARYPGVRCIRQKNRGLAAARNTGLRWSRGSYLVFLDADDRLLPRAIEVGLDCFRAHPECAFVSGRHWYITADGSYISNWWEGLARRNPRKNRRKRQKPVAGRDPINTRGYYEALLRWNYIGMHATVMYRRAVLDSMNGFDASLPACEDYDLYLRIARIFPVQCHHKVVAEYRWHGANMSIDNALMLGRVLTVHRVHWKYARGNTSYEAAFMEGVRNWRDFYGVMLAEDVRTYLWAREWGPALRGLGALLRHDPHRFAAWSVPLIKTARGALTRREANDPKEGLRNRRALPARPR